MRHLSSWVLASLAGLALVAVTPLVAQPKTGAMLRTPDGHPDLQGIWTNATITPMERLPVFAGKLTVPDAEAAKFEHQANGQTYGDQRNSNAEADRDHAYNALFFDRGTELARVDGEKR